MEFDSDRLRSFIRDLEATHAALHPSWSADFVSALEQAHAAIRVSNGVDLDHLGRCFDDWRDWAKTKIEQYRKRLPANDPSLCPISLFRTMDFGRLETAHTRTLAWLLSPHGEHGFGDRLLGALLRHLAPEEPLEKLNVDLVASEVPIDGRTDDEYGRLDVLAKGQWHSAQTNTVRWVLAIEAKIDAHEGFEQLAKYEAWLDREARCDRTFRILLTKDGCPAETANQHWHQLSFLDLVKIFRQAMSELAGTEGVHFLRYYLAGVLQDVCGWPRGGIDKPTDPYAVVAYLMSVN